MKFDLKKIHPWVVAASICFGSIGVLKGDNSLTGSPNITRDTVVVFNEIHYHPVGDNTAHEYVEIYNQLAVDVDISNWRIDGIGYDFPEGTVIEDRSYLVIAKDPASYPGALGPYSGTLSNSGETLRLYNNNRAFRTTSGGGSVGVTLDSNDRRRIMDEISYGDTFPWTSGADGSGSTLSKIDPTTGSAHPKNWTFSTSSNGTPGIANDQVKLPALALNEIGATGSPAFQVELYNHGTVMLDLGGMVIASSNPLLADYTLPAGTLAPGAYTSIDAVTLGFTPNDNNRLFLFTAGKSALVDAARADDELRGRFPDGTGSWLRPDVATFGDANSFDLEDGIVINEIFYHAYPIRAEEGIPSTFFDSVVLDYDATWRYNLNAGAAGLPAGWEDNAHLVDGTSWDEGPGLLGRELSTLGEPLRTFIPTGRITYYFETEFNYGGGGVEELQLEHYIDDGAVIYLNGIEINRFNIPTGAVTPSTVANPVVSNAVATMLTIENPALIVGSNRLSIEVHQDKAGSSDIVFGMKATLRLSNNDGTPDIPYSERAEEWLELHNRSAAAIDLTGWSLDGGVSYDFPAATSIPAGGYLVVAKDRASLATKHPAATIIGDYSGKLGNGGDTIVLEDAVGNPADEVTYFDSGKWHAQADGGGSSLELIDPDSDNSNAGAWGPSDEGPRGSWQTYTYEGIAVDDGIGNNAYHEFLIALLDAGEFLLDDVSVIENDTLELIQNGDFEGDTLGATADKWRAVGTHGSHGRTLVVNDLEDPGNQCLHVVATGPTEDKHNKVETTFANGERLVPGNTYRISFRAKFISGSNQVNTRLYFNFLQRTTHLATPEIWGSPGEVNSIALPNVGPTLEGLIHSPLVPDANEAVTVSICARDPDGINDVRLFFSVNGGGLQIATMTEVNGRYVGTIPGQAASRIVRFYVRARDGSNTAGFSPAAAGDGGAFYKVEDGLADTSGRRHNLRVIMAESDRQFLFTDTNLMSNDRFPATVIEDENTVYYNVGLRLKASAFGRDHSDRYGFNLRFQPDNLFRGVHGSISIERSRPFVELFAKHLLSRAGGAYWSFYDDVAHIVPPTTSDRGLCLISMARHTSNFFEGLFPNAEEPGTLFNQELLYNPSGTDTGDPEGLKDSRPYNHNGGSRYDLADRGPDKEPYRWGFQIRSSRGRDDYSQLVAVSQALGSLSGDELKDAIEPLIDVDQWMRTFAMTSLTGSGDVYGRANEHNFRYYMRPGDRKLICMQWDLDGDFSISTNSSITPSRNNIRRLFSIPQYRRLFDGHLHDIISTSYNTSYAGAWASHYNSVTGESFSSYRNYVGSRGNFALGTLPSSVPFAITTNGGSGFSVAESFANLAGNGWVDVFEIEVNGISTPVTWTDEDSWEISTPIAVGENPLGLKAYNNHGVEVGTAMITVTNTGSTDLASAANTIVSELHYHPADPSESEMNVGFIDADDFEFIELTNTSSGDIDLTGAAFTDGITFTFPSVAPLAPGESLILVANPTAFQTRYGVGAVTIAGTYTGNLRNSGEQVRLQAADASTIVDFTYGDDSPWPTSSDGGGYSLILAGTDTANPLHWRPSTTLGGNPGGTDRIAFTGNAEELIDYSLSGDAAIKLMGDTFFLIFNQNLAADDAEILVEFSADLITWTPADVTAFVSRENQGDGTAKLTYQSSVVPGSTRQFARVRVRLR